MELKWTSKALPDLARFYNIVNSTIYLLRLWHTRENR